MAKQKNAAGANDGQPAAKPTENWFQKNPTAAVAAIAASILALLGLVVGLTTVVANAATTNRINDYVETHLDKFRGPPGPQGLLGPAGRDGLQGLQGPAGQNGQNGRDAIPGLEVPIGTIVAWHQDLDGTPALPADGPWVRCDGKTLEGDAYKNSVYFRRVLPNLNGDANGQPNPAPTHARLFLRGSTKSGDYEVDAIKEHTHSRVGPQSKDVFIVGSRLGPQVIPSENGRKDGFVIEARDDTGPNVGAAGETNPKNMSVVWIIRVM